MSEEEIKKQYANGIVNADEVIKSLIDKFKTDKTSVDIQQLQLIAEYLLYKVDKLQKENYELNSDLEVFKRALTDVEKENEKLKDNSINKDIIRDKIKKAEKNYESCSKGNVVEKAYYRNKIDTLKELLGE